MAIGRGTISDTLASQKTAAITRPDNSGKGAASPADRSAHSRPTVMIKKTDLGMPHQKAVSEFVTKASVEVRRRNRIFEISFMAVCAIGLLATGIAAWYTDGRIFSDAASFLQKFEPEANQGRNRAANCKDPRNANTPYCQGSAPSASGKTSFGSIAGVGKGKPLPFTLHGN